MDQETLQPDNSSYRNDVQSRHRSLSEFAASNSNLSAGDRLFNATYGTGEHIAEATDIKIAGGMVEAKEALEKDNNTGLLVYLASEPPVRVDYKVVNRDGLYMLVDFDGIPYAVTKNAALLQEYLNSQAA